MHHETLADLIGVLGVEQEEKQLTVFWGVVIHLCGEGRGGDEGEGGRERGEGERGGRGRGKGEEREGWGEGKGGRKDAVNRLITYNLHFST